MRRYALLATSETAYEALSCNDFKASAYTAEGESFGLIFTDNIRGKQAAISNSPDNLMQTDASGKITNLVFDKRRVNEYATSSLYNLWFGCQNRV